MHAGDDPGFTCLTAGDDPTAIREGHMSWIILFFAGLFEVGWAVGLKSVSYTHLTLPTIYSV